MIYASTVIILFFREINSGRKSFTLHKKQGFLLVAVKMYIPAMGF